MKIEWAPQPKQKYLDDLTSFDAYVQGVDMDGAVVGLGIEVKYTEHGYRMSESEAKRVNDLDSTYWRITRASGLFLEDGCSQLAEDDLRQIWRNHLLGLAMVRRKDIAKFVSVTLYPSGNKHFTNALANYQTHLVEAARDSVYGCTFEDYIACLRGDREIDEWKHFLSERYLVEQPI